MEPSPEYAPVMARSDELPRLIVPSLVAEPFTFMLATLPPLPVRLMVPALFSAAAVTVLGALMLPLPTTTKLLLVSVPGIEHVVPPLPPSSTCSSPETVRFPLGLMATPLRRNNRPAMLLSPVSALLLLVSDASATRSLVLSRNKVAPLAIVVI